MSDSMSSRPHEVWQLVLYDDTDTPIRTFIMTADTLTIGRELYHDIPLDDIRISKQHAQLTLNEAGQLIIEDLHSVNGTLVNNEPVIKPISLEPDDYITLGPFIFKVVKGPPPPPESMAAIPESRVATQVHPTDAEPTPAPSSGWGARMIILTVVLVILLLVIVAGLTAGGFFLLGQFQEVAQATPTPVTEEIEPIAELEGEASRPQVTINQAPADGDVLSANEPIIIQAVASDSQGVSRLELWVNGTKVDQIVSQLAELAPSMSAAFQWSAEEPGEYGLEFRAYNAPGLVEIVPIGTVMVVGELQGTTPQPTVAPTETPAPPTETPTITPIPETVVTVEEAPTITPTPTPSGVAALTITAPTLNVRAGPSVQYPLVGQLRQGQQLQITGQGDVGQGRWWQIPYAAAPGRVGWVIADSALVSAVNVGGVPLVPAPPLPTAVPTDTPPPAIAIGSQPIEPTATPESTATPAPREVLRAPDGQTLVIISNRSIGSLPAVFTLSGGRTVGGGREIKVVPGIDEQIVLAPDSYRAQWSAPNGFTRAFSFDAVAGKVMVMWAIPDTNTDEIEIYDELIIDGGEETDDPTPTPESDEEEAQPADEGYTAPPGRALFVAGNRSLNNSFASLTISGGSFGGGEAFTLDANTETPLELAPGDYRAVWTTPAGDGFTATRDFEVVAGQVIISYIVPEDGRLVVEFE